MDSLKKYLALSNLRNAHLIHNTDDWIKQDKGCKSDWMEIAFPSKKSSKLNSEKDFINYLVTKTKVFTFVKIISRRGIKTEIYEISSKGRYLIEDMLQETDVFEAVEIDFTIQRRFFHQIGLK